MKKVSLTNGSGSWFNVETAVCFKEDSQWNGSNNISLATKSQFEHEWLYITKSGRYILNSWSQRQDSFEIFEEITQNQAAQWMSVNNNTSDDLNLLIDKMEI